MFAKRLPLLSAFAGGCLSSAALIGFWHVDAVKRPAKTESSVSQRGADAFVSPPATTSPVRERALPNDASAERPAQPPGEPASQLHAEAAESATAPGSSVADVLSHLEADYRQALAVADVRDTPTKAGRELSPTGSGSGPRTADREPPAPQQPTAVTEPPPPLTVAHEEAALARADTAAPPKNATAQVAPMSDAPMVLASRSRDDARARDDARFRDDTLTRDDARFRDDAVARDDARFRDDVRPREDYVGDARPNVYVGNIYQGDVYQVQQLAVLQYIQLLAPLAGLASPAQMPRGLTARRTTPFSSSLTNPDNPWGFTFRPPVLVK